MSVALLPVPEQGAQTARNDHASLKRRSVRGAAATLGAQAVRFVLQFGSQIALAHWLAPGAFGLVAMVAPVMSLVQIFNDLGLSQATVQKPDITAGELSGLFWINLAISLTLALALALAAPAIARFYRAPDLAPIVAACALLLVVGGAAAQQVALMNRHLRFTVLAGMDVACSGMAALCGLLAAWQGLGAWSLVIMQAANALTILVLAWTMSDWVPGWPRRGQNVMGLLRFGGHLTGFNMLAYAEANLGSVLIGRLQGAVALGFYDRAYKLVIVPWWQISLPVARVAVSLLSRLAGQDRDYANAWRRMLQGLLLVATPGLLWAALLSATLVPAVLGRQWASCAPMVTDLALATALVPFGAGAYWLFVSQGRVRAQLRYAMATGLALVLSSAIGAHWGALGVARAYLACAPFAQIVPLWGATRHGPVRAAAAWCAAWPILVGLSAAACAVLLAQPALGHSWLSLGLALVLSYTACGAAMLAFPQGMGVVRDVLSLRAMLRRA